MVYRLQVECYFGGNDDALLPFASAEIRDRRSKRPPAGNSPCKLYSSTIVLFIIGA